MILNSRPSKIYFHNVFKKTLDSIDKYSSVLDCACGNGKFRKLFKQGKYYGVDIDVDKLNYAKKNYENSCTKFIFDNLVHFSSEIRDSKFDLVVSTHTIYALPAEYISQGISNLVDKVNYGGTLVIQSPKNYLSILNEKQNQFSRTKIYNYRNVFSQLFEHSIGNLFGTDCIGGIGKNNDDLSYKILKYPILFLSLLISQLERFLPIKTDNILYVFYEKK